MPFSEHDRSHVHEEDEKNTAKVPLRLLLKRILSSKSKKAIRHPEIIVTPPSPIISLAYHDFLGTEDEFVTLDGNCEKGEYISYILSKPKKIKVTLSRRKIREILIPGIMITPPISEKEKDTSYDEYELIIKSGTIDPEDSQSETCDIGNDTSSKNAFTVEYNAEIRRSKSLSSLPSGSARKSREKRLCQSSRFRKQDRRCHRKNVCEGSLLNSLFVAVAAAPLAPLDLDLRGFKVV